MPALSDLISLLDDWFPPATAEAWDAVGLVLGDPGDPISAPEPRTAGDSVTKVLLAVDPNPEVAAEAAAWGADLLITHHPLFLKPVHGVAATTAKGRTLATLAKAGCALFTAHTNADQAVGGVSEAMATALGLSEQQPIIPAGSPRGPLDKLVVFVPVDASAPVRAAIAEAGAGAIGDYDHCSFSTPGTGRFRPLDGARPAIGTVGTVETVDEERIEAVLPRARRADVVRAMLAAHPYEEPAYDLVEVADPGTSSTGTGRQGLIAAVSLAEFAQVVAESLPETAQGVRVAGDPERVVRRVAVCGGAGDFLLDQMARADVDVYVTSDLRHHPAAEFVEKGGPALIDVAHWAAESTWLPVLQARLGEALGDTVEIRVSAVRTDPWTFRA